MKTNCFVPTIRTALAVGISAGWLFTSPRLVAQGWTLTSAPLKAWTALASSADGVRLVATDGNGAIYVSADAGTNWGLTTAPSNWWIAVASSADGTRLAAGPGPGVPVYTSPDSGATWTPTTVPAANWSGVACSGDGSNLVAVGWPSPVYLSHDAGANWTIANGPPSDKWFSAACSADGRVIIAVQNYGAIVPVPWISMDGGTTWSSRSIGAFPANITWSSVACSADGSKLAVGVEGFGVSTSTNGGTIWTRTTAYGNFHNLACSADGNTLIGNDLGAVVTSTNFGKTWRHTPLPLIPGSPVAISADGKKMVAAASEGSNPGIYIYQATPAPVLNIASPGGEVQLSWIVPSMPFGLQQTSDLNSTTWTAASVEPALNYSNLQYQVTLANPQTPTFYRLVRQ